MTLTSLIIILMLNICWIANNEVNGEYFEIRDSTLRRLTTSLKTKQDELEKRITGLEKLPLFCHELYCGGSTMTKLSEIDTICERNTSFEGVVHDLSPEFLEFGLNFGARYCEKGWTVIQRRGTTGSNFDRSWEEYKKGFGVLSEDFWFGNDFIHFLTHLHDLRLRIELESFEGEKGYAEYDIFKVDSEREAYRLRIGGYSGNLGDSFAGHDNAKFTVNGRDFYCAKRFQSGWWFHNCLTANLNGIYYDSPRPKFKDHYGIIWSTWKGKIQLKRSKMMVKPK